ncbi:MULTISPECIES: hypothetical protein [unclassified Mesorhizobium]|uniref:hypothetical protein n=1 Tax=unclassified Mesorhizobium TaxID=325217 RepID=UPI0006FA4F84|nr:MULTISPECIES: hypothetical protein [unclassified Mesorhizobium]KQZ12844.1 hypothetical protein ASD27_01245 [Mesorhizobium sp. Root1471]KQZ35364.1 hypothetical protein ASD44_01245 [Mesorhizobium sp. Root554]MDR7031606.1 hypothetical protein [Mesorhizobium sp. BE184]
MTRLLAGMAFFMLVTAQATAETPYDRKLEQAVMRIVAAKMGDIRGGFSYAQTPQLIRAPSVPFAAPREEASAGAKDAG